MVLLLTSGCTVGAGEGEVEGELWIPQCGLQGAPYELRPRFFVADPVADLLEIRIQRTSQFPDVTDGIVVTVLRASAVRQRLGERLPLGGTEPLGEGDPPRVEMAAYFNDTCPPSHARGHAVYVARSGWIRFDAIYAPAVDSESIETAAQFGDVVLDAGATGGAEGGRARLRGWFRFLFNRGRPAQRFP